jgi:hypothetical protein
MANWITGAITLLGHSIDAVYSRLAGDDRATSCTSCGKRKSKSEMSEIPYHGFFCNDEEAVKYWNEKFEFSKVAKPDVKKQGAMNAGPQLSRTS